MTLRIEVPPELELAALARIEAKLTRAPAHCAIELDFAQVRECRPLVFARLLARLARQERTQPVELVNLSEQQQRLLARARRGPP